MNSVGRMSERPTGTVNAPNESGDRGPTATNLFFASGETRKGCYLFSCRSSVTHAQTFSTQRECLQPVCSLPSSNHYSWRDDPDTNAA
jgi:hypothetical protein